MSAADLCPACCEQVVEPIFTDPTDNGVWCVYGCPCGHIWTTSWALTLAELEASP